MFIHEEQLNCMRADTRNVFMQRNPNADPGLCSGFLAFPSGIRWMLFFRTPSFIM